MNNYGVAKCIMELLKFQRKDPVILSALKDVCLQCEKYGSASGKRCVSLKMARENGWTDFVPPFWCRDKEGEHCEDGQRKRNHAFADYTHMGRVCP